MVINGEVVNFPNADLLNNQLYLPFISTIVLDEREIFWTLNLEVEMFPPDVKNLGIERYVANGMMMVVIEDMQKSTRFEPGDEISTLRSTKIRLGPGSNYPGITTLPANSTGTVLDHLNDLEGVFAKGEYWWKVSVSGIEGWIPESAIVLAGS
jgi:hypothetical protein